MVVSIFVKKNTLVYSSAVTSDNITPFTTITDSTSGFGVNEFKGYYVKVNGYVAWIVSNNSTTITLQSGISVTVGNQYEIYKSDFQRLDLFQDEKISVTSSLQNANDLGKIYTDYSQSFTIPASKRNNEILSHWHESAIDGGYDHRKRYDAYIEIYTHRFKNGNIQLEKASHKNGFVENYTITFYGNLTQLKDKFKDTKLRDLPTGSLSAFYGTDNFWGLFNHTYNSTEIRNRITATIPQNVYYPLIGSSKKYFYKNGIADQDITLTTSPVVWNELFPAVSMEGVFSLIQLCFGVTFTGSFFSLDQWTKLYLYLKNAEVLKVQSETSTVLFSTKSGTPNFNELNLTNETLTTSWSWIPSNILIASLDIKLKITPTTSTIYTVYVYRDGLLYKTLTDLSGTQTLSCDILSYIYDRTLHSYTFKISSESLITFNSQLIYTQKYFDISLNSYITNVKNAYNSNQSTVGNIQLSNYVPDITVNDFITGIIKAFNLMIIPTDVNTFEFVPLELYYNQGKILDITKYVYSDEMDIERPKLFKAINFQYEKSTNILNNAYKGLYGTEYGDLIYTNNNSNESSNYDIKLPFENVLFEKTVGENFETATIVDKDLKPYIPKPMLIYKNGSQQIDLSNPIRITTETGHTTIGNYNRFSNEYNSLPTDLTYSHLMTMNFNNEQSPWYNVIAPQGLYLRHYKNFIENLYSIKTRIVKIKAILPTSLLGSTVLNSSLKPIGLALNDRLIIRNKRYIINSFTTDLTTGEASFELITDYRGIDAASTVGYRFASYENVQVDFTQQTINEVIFLNDYDYFDVQITPNFLVYDVLDAVFTDVNLEVTIPINTTGVDRNDIIEIRYFKNNSLARTEYITVLQQADYLFTENNEIITTESDQPLTLN